MQLGAQVEWGLHCVAALAALPADARLSAAALAELFEVPPKYLAKALQALAGAEIVSTTPGPRGGYRLARDPAQLTVLDVVDAIEGRQPVFICQEIRRRGPCRGMKRSLFAAPCQITSVMRQAEHAFRSTLAAKTIATLLAEVTHGVPREVLASVGEWVGERVSH